MKTKRPALWVDVDPNVPGSCSYPHFEKILNQYYDSTCVDSFSTYWNREIGYPSNRFYEGKQQWRLYFDSDADRTAWVLGFTNFNRNNK